MEPTETPLFNIETSQSLAEIAKSLIKFHDKVGKIKKTATGIHSGKYAPLPEILDTVDPILVECKLTVIQLPVGEYALHTRVIHESGEFIGGTYKMTPKTKDPQGQGSAITYQRRYALGAVLNLNIDEDTDGANGGKTPKGTAVTITIETIKQDKTAGKGVPFEAIKTTDGEKYLVREESGLVGKFEEGKTYKVTHAKNSIISLVAEVKHVSEKSLEDKMASNGSN